MRDLLKSRSGLPPAILQLIGISLMLIAIVVWLFPPHDFNAALFGGGGSLIGISEFAGATARLNEIQRKLDQYTSKSSTKSHRGRQ